jgi:hypothetical protein
VPRLIGKVDATLFREPLQLPDKFGSVHRL